MAVVYPMHDLFLGTAKHIMQFWVDNVIITKNDLRQIEKVVVLVDYPQKFLQVLLGFQLTSGEIGHLFTLL